MAKKGLPKKYAKMGFAKGWRAYKASKRKSSSVRTRTVKTTKRKKRSYTMARRKKTYRRKRGMSQTTKMMLGGAGYGMVRGPLNSLASKVPLVGQFGDEVALLACSWAIAKYGKGALKSVGYAGMAIEAHNLARNFNVGNLFGGSSSGTTGNGW